MNSRSLQALECLLAIPYSMEDTVFWQWTDQQVGLNDFPGWSQPWSWAAQSLSTWVKGWPEDDLSTVYHSQHQKGPSQGSRKAEIHWWVLGFFQKVPKNPDLSVNRKLWWDSKVSSFLCWPDHISIPKSNVGYQIRRYSWQQEIQHWV